MWRWSIVLLFGCLQVTAMAQSAADLALVAGRDVHEHRFDRIRPQYLFANSSRFVKYNPVTAVFGGLMYGYQRFLSPQLSADCAYHQSCSRFSVAAIREFGLIKGIALSADRLTRCSPFAMYQLPKSALHPESGKIVESLDLFKHAGK